MNNTVKYTIVAAVIIIAAAFGIQTFVGKAPVPGSDLSAMTPAAGEESATDESVDETNSSSAAMEANPPAPTPDQTTTAAPAAPAMEGTTAAPEAAASGTLAPSTQEPAAGTPGTQPMEGQAQQPSTPESVPSFEDEKSSEEPVEN